MKTPFTFVSVGILSAFLMVASVSHAATDGLKAAKNDNLNTMWDTDPAAVQVTRFKKAGVISVKLQTRSGGTFQSTPAKPAPGEKRNKPLIYTKCKVDAVNRNLLACERGAKFSMDARPLAKNGAPFILPAADVAKDPVLKGGKFQKRFVFPAGVPIPDMSQLF